MINDIVNTGLQQPEKQVREVAPAPADVFELSPIGSKDPVEQSSAKDSEKLQPQQLQTAVSKLNDYVQNVQRTLSFSVEEVTGITVVQVLDSETDELIRQIPAEETIKLAASIAEFNTNLLVNEQA
ncbi:MAG: flagellar protein FlaG [Oceanicoccus sp.]